MYRQMNNLRRFVSPLSGDSHFFCLVESRVLYPSRGALNHREEPPPENETNWHSRTAAATAAPTTSAARSPTPTTDFDAVIFRLPQPRSHGPRAVACYGHTLPQPLMRSRANTTTSSSSPATSSTMFPRPVGSRFIFVVVVVVAA
uniref:Uncharacterized protein n=1 Tax=Steinernema glaseri TaxID=37863 RepID=A0A1I7YYB2_9BILA